MITKTMLVIQIKCNETDTHTYIMQQSIGKSKTSPCRTSKTESICTVGECTTQDTDDASEYGTTTSRGKNTWEEVIESG